jgi:hypothetical protein
MKKSQHYVNRALIVFAFLGIGQMGCPIVEPQTVSVGLVGHMAFTPFDPVRYPDRKNILTKISGDDSIFFGLAHPESADIIVGENLSDLLPYLQNSKFADKKFLIWQEEPRQDIHRDPVLDFQGTPVHVMNVYTKDVFLNNYYFFYHFDSFRPDSQLRPATKETLASKQKKAVMVATYASQNDGSIYVTNMVPEDLALLRAQVGLTGYRLGAADIYGQQWPAGISRGGDGFAGNYEKKKFELVEKYKFNLAFENTNYEHYVTEKIWDAIQAYSLPVYFGNSWIYEDFPENSFVDYSKFSSPEQLFAFLDAMTDDEWVTRMNLCIDVFNRVFRIAQTTEVHFGRDQRIKSKMMELAGKKMK